MSVKRLITQLDAQCMTSKTPLFQHRMNTKIFSIGSIEFMADRFGVPHSHKEKVIRSFFLAVLDTDTERDVLAPYRFNAIHILRTLLQKPWVKHLGPDVLESITLVVQETEKEFEDFWKKYHLGNLWNDVQIKS